MSDGWLIFLQVLKRVSKGISVWTTKGLSYSLAFELVSVKCMTCCLILDLLLVENVNWTCRDEGVLVLVGTPKTHWLPLRLERA